MTNEKHRNDFLQYLKQVKQEWVIAKEAEKTILKEILSHKDSKLLTYISYFKGMIEKMKNDFNTTPDIYSESPPVGGKCVDSFIGIINNKDYNSKCTLRLFFSKSKKEIYGFEVLM